MIERTDIAIAGAGPAGLIAAAALASTGREVMLIDPAHPVTNRLDPKADHRSTAFLQPAMSLFDRIGIWQELRSFGQPLRALRIVDLAGDPAAYRDERCFTADGFSGDVFGWNFANWQIRATLLTQLENLPNVTLYMGKAVKGMLARTSEIRLKLSCGTQVSANLVVGADGRSSAIRELAGIGHRTTRYGQKSLAFTVHQDIAHEDVSTEIYHVGGPFTMVPMPAQDGKHTSAVVWMNDGARSQALCQMDKRSFNAELYARSAGLFGRLELSSPRGLFPIVTQTADALVSERVALIAEAAHVLPPIGAQGLNTSVNDIMALLGILDQTDDPGDPVALTNYEKTRRADIARRSSAIDIFNRVAASGLPPLQSLRLAGLKAAHDIKPLREKLTQAGMGPN